MCNENDGVHAVCVYVKGSFILKKLSIDLEIDLKFITKNLQVHRK